MIILVRQLYMYIINLYKILCLGNLTSEVSNVQEKNIQEVALANLSTDYGKFLNKIYSDIKAGFYER